jgi:hypothetical protein
MSDEDMPRDVPNEEEQLSRAIVITQRYLGELEDTGMVEHPDISASYNNSTLAGLAATVHTCAVIPNFVIAECFINQLSACDEIAIAAIEVKDGWIELPTRPGLGIDIDVARLRKHPYRSYEPRGLRHYWQEFPRKNYRIPSRLQGAQGVEKEAAPPALAGE